MWQKNRRQSPSVVPRDTSATRRSLPFLSVNSFPALTRPNQSAHFVFLFFSFFYYLVVVGGADGWKRTTNKPTTAGVKKKSKRDNTTGRTVFLVNATESETEAIRVGEVEEECGASRSRPSSRPDVGGIRASG